MNLSRSRASRLFPVVALAAFALALTGCGSSSGSDTTPATSATETTAASSSPSESTAMGSGDVTIAAFNFGESKIIASMYAAVLDKAGYNADVKELTTREVVQPALQKGEVQVAPEYVGTLTEFLNKAANGPQAKPMASGDLDATVTALRSLAEPLNLTVLEASPAADQNAFAVTQEFATKNNLTTLSDLAAYSKSNDVTLGGPPECPTRPFCQQGLENTYGMKFAGFKSLDTGGPLTKKALQQGSIDVGLVFSSDGGVSALGLQVLDDDKKLQTVDNIIPVVSGDLGSQAPLVDALNGVSAALTTDELIELNKAVDIDRKDPKTVAEDYLRSKGLL